MKFLALKFKPAQIESVFYSAKIPLARKIEADQIRPVRSPAVTKITMRVQKAARKIKIARKTSAKCASQQLFYLLQILFEKLRFTRILRDECGIETRHEANATLVKNRAV